KTHSARQQVKLPHCDQASSEKVFGIGLSASDRSGSEALATFCHRWRALLTRQSLRTAPRPLTWAHCVLAASFRRPGAESISTYSREARTHQCNSAALVGFATFSRRASPTRSRVR